MKKIKILSKFITILSASFLICSNFNAMENINNKNLKTNNTNNINTNANENNSKNKKIFRICKNYKHKKDIKHTNNNANLLNKKRNKNDSVNNNNNNQLINNKKNIPYDKNKFKSKKNKNIVIEIKNKDNAEITLNMFLENFCIPFPEYFNRITNDSLFDFIHNSEFVPTTDKISKAIQTNKDLKENRNYIVNNIEKYIDYFQKRNPYAFSLKNFVKNCLEELNEYNIHNTYLQTENLDYNLFIRDIFFAKYVSSILGAIENDNSLIIENTKKIKIFDLKRLISFYLDNLKSISINLEKYFKKLYDDGLSSKYIADPSLYMIIYCLGMLTTEQNEDANEKNSILTNTYNSIFYTNKELLESGLHKFLYTSLVSFISYLDHEINIQNKKIYSSPNLKYEPIRIKRLYLIVENFEKILNFEITICKNCEKYINDYMKNIKERLKIENPESLHHIQDAKTYNNFVKDTSTHYINMIATLKKQLKKQYLECKKPKNVPSNIKIKNDESPLVFPQNLNNVNEPKNCNFNISSNNLNSYDNNKFSNNDLNIPNNLNDVEFDQQEDAGLHLRDSDEQRSSNDNLLCYFNDPSENDPYEENLYLNDSSEEYFYNMFKQQLNNLNDVKSAEQQKYNNIKFYDNNLNNTNKQIDHNMANLQQLNNLNNVKSAEQQKYNNIKFSDKNLNNTNKQIDHNMANLQQLNNPNDVKSDEQKNIKKNLFNPLKYEKYDLQDLKKVTEFSLDEEDDANQIDDEKIKTSNQMNEDFLTINLSECLNGQSFNDIYEKLIKNLSCFFEFLAKVYIIIEDYHENDYINLQHVKFMQESKTSMDLCDYYNALYSLSVVLDILVSLSDNYYDLYKLLYEVSENELNMNDKIDENKIKFFKKELIPLIENMKNQLKDVANMFHDKVEKEFPLEKIYSIEDLITKIFADKGKILKEEILDKQIINDINHLHILPIYNYTKKFTDNKKNKILKNICEKNEKYKFFLQNRLKFINLEKSLKFKENFLNDVINNKYTDLSKNINDKFPDLLKKFNLYISKLLKKETNKFLQIYNNSQQKLDESETYKPIKENFFKNKINLYVSNHNNNFDRLYDSHEKKELEKNKQKNRKQSKHKNDKNIKASQPMKKTKK